VFARERQLCLVADTLVSAARNGECLEWPRNRGSYRSIRSIDPEQRKTAGTTRRACRPTRRSRSKTFPIRLSIHIYSALPRIPLRLEAPVPRARCGIGQ
jgi:hypothetical protein